MKVKKMCCWLSLIFLTTRKGSRGRGREVKRGVKHKNNKTVNALREVQAVNVNNIPHYIHVISECTPSDAVSNLCDRFRWTLVQRAQHGESSLGLTQASKYKISSRQKGASLSARAACLFSPPLLTAKVHTQTHTRACMLHANTNFMASLDFLTFSMRHIKTRGRNKQTTGIKYISKCWKAVGHAWCTASQYKQHNRQAWCSCIWSIKLMVYRGGDSGERAFTWNLHWGWSAWEASVSVAWLMLCRPLLVGHSFRSGFKMKPQQLNESHFIKVLWTF